MSLGMYGFVDLALESSPAGGVTLIQSGADGFYDYDNGGAWVPPAGPDPRPLTAVNIQSATKKTLDFIVAKGGTADPKDLRNVYVNDGTQLFPADTGRESDFLEFSDGLSVRRWRVLTCDNRPWRNYCHAIVERTDQEAT